MNTAANHTQLRAGRSSAICQYCDRRSRRALADDSGEPDLWKMARGWSQAPFPADYKHRDGSIGSVYTCPACNARLNNGESLRTRSVGASRLVLA